MANEDFIGNQTAQREPPEAPTRFSLNGQNGERLKPLSGIQVDVEVKDRLFRELKRQLVPNEVLGILQMAQTGDLYWQDQLFSNMVDTWPRLSTNLGKVKAAVRGFDYVVKPYVRKGEKPTSAAIDKANFVEEALFGMQSLGAWGFHDFKETLEDLVDAIVSGCTILEIYWENRSNLGIVPKYTRWIPARYYRYPYVMNAVDRLMLNPSGLLGSTQLVDFPPYQFLQGIYRSHANFAVFTAPMRSLTGWWMGAQFGLQWLMTYAQICGIPQRIAYYEPGDDKVYAELVSMMQRSASASWGVYPKGTQIEFQTAGGSESANPQERLVELADKMCDIVMLGQTLTTEVHQSGSRALGTVHKSVWEEKTEAAAYYVTRVINSDLVPGIVEFNYGNTDELPVLEPVVESNIDLVQMANAFSILFGAGQNGMKIPVTKEELYRRLEFTQPDPDADLYDPLGGQTAAAAPSSPARQSGEGPPKEAGLGGGGDALKEAGGKIEPETSEFLPASASDGLVEAKRGGGKPSVKKKPALDRGPVEEAEALANELYFAQNAALIRGVDWRSVMDDRTTEECRELNGKRWSYPDFEPQGHGAEWPGFPPIRWNCRSRVKPVLRIGATPGKPVVRVRTVGKKVRRRKVKPVFQ